MATLQKFKFLATQCAVVSSPTRSPTTSPVIHLRRRKTLRMLLGRGGTSGHHRRFLRREESSDRSPPGDRSVGDDEDRPRPRHHQNHIGVRHKLKDLFISSPPPPALPPPPTTTSFSAKREGDQDIESGAFAGTTGLVVTRRIMAGPIRPLSATLRQRLLRRPWRPVLVGIPEQSP